MAETRPAPVPPGRRFLVRRALDTEEVVTAPSAEEALAQAWAPEERPRTGFRVVQRGDPTVEPL
jgi:hypothetical protein